MSLASSAGGHCACTPAWCMHACMQPWRHTAPRCPHFCNKLLQRMPPVAETGCAEPAGIGQALRLHRPLAAGTSSWPTQRGVHGGGAGGGGPGPGARLWALGLHFLPLCPCYAASTQQPEQEGFVPRVEHFLCEPAVNYRRLKSLAPTYPLKVSGRLFGPAQARWRSPRLYVVPLGWPSRAGAHATPQVRSQGRNASIQRPCMHAAAPHAPAAAAGRWFGRRWRCRSRSRAPAARRSLTTTSPSPLVLACSHG